MTVIRPEITVLARVRAGMRSLGPSETRVAEIILAQPVEVVDWSTTELATAAGTSTATVIRACQNLGFRGFQHLRLELARAAPLVHPVTAEVHGDTFDEAVDALRLAQESVHPELIVRAADELRAARRVVLVGNGFSGPPLQDFAMRLSTRGRSVEAPIDPLAQQFAVTSLSTGDVCLALSYSGANVQTLRACTAASEHGAHVILVTSYARSPLGRLADTTIATGPAAVAHDVDPFLARLGHTVVLHALHEQLAEESAQSDVEGIRHAVADALSDD